MRLLSSTITLRSLRLWAYHGVLPHEREVGGEYVVSLSVRCDIARALCTDDVADTLNYAALAALVADEMARPSRLIEHVAGRMARTVLARFPQAQEVRVSVRKCQPPMPALCDGAEVELVVARD